jgi:succinoglycan biosynthesis protein ExoV
MLYYCKTPEGNFGDDLNLWLWPRLAPEVCEDIRGVLFVGIGTILSHRMPREPLKVVFGAGWGGARLPKIDDRWIFYCVRGPLTAAALRLEPDLALVDPAILVRAFTPRPAAKEYPVAFMPHHQSMAKADWPALCARIGVHCIDPRRGVEPVLTEISQTEMLLAEAMHGAIVADALRVPWIPVRLYGRFTELKWRDWTQSIGVPLKIVNVPPIFEHPPKFAKRLDYTLKRGLALAGFGGENWRRLETRRSKESEILASLKVLVQVPKEHTPVLSADETLSRLESRLTEKLSALRAKWPGLV